MKRILLILFCLILLVGCSSNQQSAKPKNGVITIPYEKPVDFKQFEVFVSTTPSFRPTGWDGSKWTGQPNAPSEWNGADKTLFMVTTNDPIQVTGLTPGKTYYVQVVVVDTSNQRSIPSPEISAIAGDAQRSSTLVVAAADASPASKAGADYVCDGVDDHEEIQAAINAMTTNGKIFFTEGTFNIGVVNQFTYPIIVGRKVILEGNGSETIFKLKDGFNIDYGIFSCQADGIVFKNMTLDGNRINQDRGFQSGISNITNKNIIIENVTVKNFSDYGLVINNAFVTRCVIYGNRIGVMMTGVDTIITDNQIYGNDEQGIYLQYVNNIIVNNNVIKENGADGILIRGMNSTALSENNQISNNQVFNNGIAGDGTYSNILIKEYANKCVIQGNICRMGVGANRTKYGIRINNATCNLCIITNNDCYNSGEIAGISNAGTNTSFGAGNRNNNGTWSTTPN